MCQQDPYNFTVGIFVSQTQLDSYEARLSCHIALVLQITGPYSLVQAADGALLYVTQEVNL